MLDRNKRILIIGLGLMGGSYAMALSRQGYSVSAITLNRSDSDYALIIGELNLERARHLGDNALNALELAFDKNNVADVQIKFIVVVRKRTSLARELHLYHGFYRTALCEFCNLQILFFLFLITLKTDLEFDNIASFESLFVFRFRYYNYLKTTVSFKGQCNSAL